MCKGVVAFYFFAGLAYWAAFLLVHGEPTDVRAMPLRGRLKVHAVAMGLSLALWPLALARDLERR